ncbi:MAG: hypothetical protein OJF51_005130 [Nitrospira sp.]|jgi:hypothetical protein|nr:MAG: hypothetical protein OJF51_005130 [Nitrospira sp.]
MLGLVTYSAIVGGLVVALWKHPSIALAGVLCMFGLEQWGQASHPFFAQHQTFTNFVIGGILALGLTFKVLKGELLMANYPAAGWLVLGLFSYTFASAIWAPRSDISLNIWESRWPYVLTIVVFAPLIISNTRELLASVKALILVGALLTILLLFFVSWEARMIVLEDGRGNPLAVSAMAGLVALVVILTDPWPFSRVWNAAKWLVVGLCLFLVVRSGSRGQLFGVIGVAAVCWPISRRMENVKQFVVWTSLVLFMTGITFWALQEFWAKQENYYAGGNRWSGQAMEGAMSGRFDQGLYLVRLWFDSVETIVFGLGNSASYDPRILGIYPHFVPLEILAEEGLIGFVLFLAILYVTAQSAAKYFRQVQTDSMARSPFAALVAMFLYTLVLAFKQGSLLGNLEPFMFATILAKYVKLKDSGDTQAPLSKPVDPLPSGVLCRYQILR